MGSHTFSPCLLLSLDRISIASSSSLASMGPVSVARDLNALAGSQIIRSMFPSLLDSLTRALYMCSTDTLGISIVTTRLMYSWTNTATWYWSWQCPVWHRTFMGPTVSHTQ